MAPILWRRKTSSPDLQRGGQLVGFCLASPLIASKFRPSLLPGHALARAAAVWEWTHSAVVGNRDADVRSFLGQRSMDDGLATTFLHFRQVRSSSCRIGRPANATMVVDKSVPRVAAYVVKHRLDAGVASKIRARQLWWSRDISRIFVSPESCYSVCQAAHSQAEWKINWPLLDHTSSMSPSFCGNLENPWRRFRWSAFAARVRSLKAAVEPRPDHNLAAFRPSQPIMVNRTIIVSW